MCSVARTLQTAASAVRIRVRVCVRVCMHVCACVSVCVSECLTSAIIHKYYSNGDLLTHVHARK